MEQVIEIPTLKCKSKSNPRSIDNDPGIEPLGESMATTGQQIPILGFWEGEWFIIVEGHRRVEAARRRKMQTVKAIALPPNPTAARVLEIQASLDLHRENFKTGTRCRVLGQLQQATGSTATEIGRKVNYTQSTVTKMVTVYAGDPSLLNLLDDGRIDLEKAYIIVSSEPDHAKQRELAKLAPGVSRDQLRRKLKNNVPTEAKSSSARFCMPGGYVIQLSGGQVDLTTAVEVLTETVRLLKKALAQGLSLASQVKVMRDTSHTVKSNAG